MTVSGYMAMYADADDAGSSALTSSLFPLSLTSCATTTTSAAANATGGVTGTLGGGDAVGHHGNVTSPARARKKSAGVRSHAHSSSLANDSSPADMVEQIRSVFIRLAHICQPTCVVRSRCRLRGLPRVTNSVTNVVVMCFIFGVFALVTKYM